MLHYDAYGEVLCLASALAAAVAFLAWRRREAPGAWALAALQVFVAQWCLGAAFEDASNTEELKWLWSKAAYLGTAATPLFFFYFAFSVGQFALRYRRSILLAAAIVPMLTVLLAASNESHHWIWTGMSINPQTNVANYRYGPWFWLFVAHSYLLLALGVIGLAVAASRFAALFRLQAGLLIAAACAPFAGNVMYVFRLSPVVGRDWTPVTFLVSGVLFYVAIRRYGMFSVVPIARAKLLDTMQDGLLVLDPAHRVADANAAMARIASCPPASLAGRLAADVFPHWRDAFLASTESDEWLKEFVSPDTEEPRWYEVRGSALRDPHGALCATLFVFRDITPRKRLEQERQRLVDELQAALAEVNTLGGLLPICSNCKKIRDDSGYWHSVEVYIETRTDASFTHSICPACIKELYPGIPGKNAG